MSSSGIFQRRRTIEEEHCDRLGHVNNIVWVEFVLELADAHSSARGFTWDTYMAGGAIWIIRHQSIDYIQAALPGDELLEETWVSEIRGARSIRHSRFTRLADGIKLLTATTQWAFVDVNTQRPKRIDRKLIDQFEPVNEQP